MTKRDFVPDSYKNLHDWAETYSTGVGAVATRIGWPTASVTAIKAQLATVSTARKRSSTRNTRSTPPSANSTPRKRMRLAQIRLATKNLKATTGFTEGDAKALGV